MAETAFQPIAIKGMDKCAIIYRSDPVSFTYVCYHCGAIFSDIDCTLQHIESHFKLVQVTVDENPLKTECNDSENAINADLGTDATCDITDPALDIKTENMESDEDCAPGIESSDNPSTFDCQRCDSVFPSKFSFLTHLLKEHFKQSAIECAKCGKKFKRDVSLENHLKQHVERGEVDWSCAGDGIREPSPETAVECSEQPSGNADASAQSEIPSEKQQVTKKNRTTQVASKHKSETQTTASKYICHKCSESFGTVDDLKDHLNAHSTEDILQLNKCKECDIYFPSPFDLRLHVLEVHLSLKKFKCSECSVEFKKKEKSLFEKHLKSHSSSDSTYWENICQGKKGKDATCYEEITTTTESSCESCEEKFYLKANRDEHNRCMHSDSERKLRCPQCKTVFTKLKLYFAHQLEHRRAGATVTETNMNVLISNLNAYIDEQSACNAVENTTHPYKCLICDTERTSQTEIRLHIRERHVYKALPQPIKPNRQEKISCNICGMAITRNSYRTHLMTHTDAKKFPCSFCGKIFSKKYSKTTHERMHTGEKPFQCDQCGKRFFSNSLLGGHKQTHDSTTYPCKICGRVFNIPSGYRRHIQTHRKDQSFECTICFKSFTTRVYLTRHMHKHNEKKFQCSFCDNKFYTAKGLQRHEESKHSYEASKKLIPF